jgi:S-adenosylmethionine:tRNA ribosyltransferase-isomerase
VLVEPARKVREGNKIFFDGHKFYCEVIGNTTSRGRTVKFSYDGNIYKIIERMGEMPIPDYIDRSPEDFDKKAYQTEFANDSLLNSIAPPSAGLHFTNNMLKDLEKKGVRIARINVHIGQGIFDEIEVEDLSKHSMFHEYFDVSLGAAEMINKTLKAKHNVYAIGGSVVRALESSVLTTGQVKPNRG